MIIKGNSRGFGKELARHLLNEMANERVEIAEMRGFTYQDLEKAFTSIEMISKATQCEKYLYSLSISPSVPMTREQYLYAIERIEKRLKLTGQSRAIVFHSKGRREHCHVVWSRIDILKMKAISDSHDRMNLRTLSYKLGMEFGHKLPAGLIEDRGIKRFKMNTAFTLAEAGQAKRAGTTPEDLRRDLEFAFRSSDSLIAFHNAVEEKGFVLARGHRGRLVVVDRSGNVFSLAKKIEGFNTKDIKAKFGIKMDMLPSVELAKETHLVKMRDKQEQFKELHENVAKIKKEVEGRAQEKSAEIVRNIQLIKEKEKQKEAIEKFIQKTDDLKRYVFKIKDAEKEQVSYADLEKHKFFREQETREKAVKLEHDKQILAMREQVRQAFKEDWQGYFKKAKVLKSIEKASANLDLQPNKSKSERNLENLPTHKEMKSLKKEIEKEKQDIVDRQKLAEKTEIAELKKGHKKELSELREGFKHEWQKFCQDKYTDREYIANKKKFISSNELHKRVIVRQRIEKQFEPIVRELDIYFEDRKRKKRILEEKLKKGNPQDRRWHSGGSARPTPPNHSLERVLVPKEPANDLELTPPSRSTPHEWKTIPREKVEQEKPRSAYRDFQEEAGKRAPKQAPVRANQNKKPEPQRSELGREWDATAKEPQKPISAKERLAERSKRTAQSKQREEPARAKKKPVEKPKAPERDQLRTGFNHQSTLSKSTPGRSRGRGREPF